jgi:predicted RND superfamily exporter protein
MSNEKQANAIKAKQDEQLAKFVKERDLLKENPELKAQKEALSNDIKRILNDMDLTTETITKIKTHLKEETDILDNIKTLKQIYAQQAYDLQNKGIFWTDKEFSIKKPQDPKLDQQAMYNKLTDEQKEQYITRTTETIIREVVTINWDKLIEKEPKIYTNPLPQIAHKKKKGDSDDNGE